MFSVNIRMNGPLGASKYPIPRIVTGSVDRMDPPREYPHTEMVNVEVLFGGMVTFIGLDVLRITYAPDPIVCSSTLLNLNDWFVGLATVS